MPKDEWRKAKDREIASRARQDFAANGGSFTAYESVFQDLTPEVPSETVIPERHVKLPRRKRSKKRRPPNNGKQLAAILTDLIQQAGSTDTHVQVLAVRQLLTIGMPAVNRLINHLQLPDSHQRQTAANVLCEFGAAARSALPALESASLSGDARSRKTAARALSVIRRACQDPVPPHAGKASTRRTQPSSDPRPTIIELAKELKSTDPVALLAAVRSINRSDPAAGQLIPALEQIRRNHEQVLRLAAAAAIYEIRSARRLRSER